jgi:tetratricopeptide (TPR) repeat protein
MALAQENIQQFQDWIQQGEFDQALLLANRLSVEHPQQWLAYSMVGDAFKAKGQYREAIRFYQFALTKTSGQPQVMRGLGQCFGHLGDLPQAYHYYLQALEIAPQDHAVLFDLGNFLIFAGETNEARMVLEKALRLGEPSARYSLLDLALYLNDLEQIKQLLDQTGTEQPPEQLVFAKAYLKLKKPQQALSLLARANNANKTRSWLQSYYQLQAQSYDALQRYDDAFDAWRLMNQQAAVNYDVIAEQQRQRQVIEFSEQLPQLTPPTPAERHCRPVFIVGLPRSGSSLLEQVLATSEQVTAGGEMLLVEPAFNACQTQAQTLHKAADDYRQHIEQFVSADRRPGVPRFITDKLPGNYLYCEFILKMLPDAKIIHCQRDPLETGFSIFKQIFTSGHTYSFDLNDIALYIKQVHTTMDYWQSRFGERIYNLQYEQLICNFDGETKRLFDFIGLDWSEQVHRFYLNELNTRTASHDQVKNPLYQHALQASANYQGQLQAFEQKLRQHGLLERHSETD